MYGALSLNHNDIDFPAGIELGGAILSSLSLIWFDTGAIYCLLFVCCHFGRLAHPVNLVLAISQQNDQPVAAWHDRRKSHQHQEAHPLQNDSEWVLYFHFIKETKQNETL